MDLMNLKLNRKLHISYVLIAIGFITYIAFGIYVKFAMVYFSLTIISLALYYYIIFRWLKSANKRILDDKYKE